MRDPTIPLYIAPYAISNPFQFTVPRELDGLTLEERLSNFISDLAVEKLPPSKASVDKTLVPQLESWVLLDLGRGTLIHSSFATAYLIESVHSSQQNPNGRIVLPTISTLTTPRLETTDRDASSRTSGPFFSKSFYHWELYFAASYSCPFPKSLTCISNVAFNPTLTTSDTTGDMESLLG